jgi:hypothetical protein
MESYRPIESIIDQSIQMIIDRLNSQHTQTKIKQKVLDPLIDYIGKRLYPYVIVASVCLLILVIAIIFFIYNITHKENS